MGPNKVLIFESQIWCQKSLQIIFIESLDVIKIWQILSAWHHVYSQNTMIKKNHRQKNSRTENANFEIEMEECTRTTKLDGPHFEGTCQIWIIESRPNSWDPNYNPGVDFLDHNFLSSKNLG